MNRRALMIGVTYSIIVIIFKLIILFGGFTLTKFGFYYSNITSILLIIPFFYLAIKLVRDKDYNGMIGGKEAIRIALTVLAVSILIISAYNYLEFNWKYKEIATQYYNSKEYQDILIAQQARYPDKIKVSSFPAIVQEQISSLSAFKATTGKLIPMMFIGLGGAFLMSILLKRNAKTI